MFVRRTKTSLGAITVALCMTAVFLTPAAGDVALPSNDDFADRKVVDSLPYSDQVVTFDASIEKDEPLPNCGEESGRTVWYEYTAETAGVVEADALGSGFDAVVSVWREDGDGGLSEVACRDNFDWWESPIQFPVAPETTYFIQLGGSDGESGNASFHMDAASTGSISGTVTSDDGRTLGRICVGLYDPTFQEVASAQTSGSGAYIFADLPDGSYKVAFWDGCNNRYDHADEYFDNTPVQDEAAEVVVVGSRPTTGVDAELRAIREVALSVEVNSSAGGTITSDPPGIECGSDCMEMYPWDTVVTLTANPGPDAEFVGFDGCEEPQGNVPRCTVDLIDGRHVMAFFNPSDGLPDVTISSGPDSLSRFRTAVFDFESSPPGATLQCALDGTAFSPCSSPVRYELLTEDGHTFEVQAINVDGSEVWPPARWNWSIDVTSPETTLTSFPYSESRKTNAQFDFQDSEDAREFECSKDGAAFTACGPWYAVYSRLDEGPHVFQVRARDGAGNVDETPEEYRWRVDTQRPETTIVSGPSGPTESTSATFEFESSEESSYFYCELDSSDFFNCESPQTFSDLSAGPHTFRVSAEDLAGNWDVSVAETTWTIVIPQAPEVTFIRPGTGVYVNDQAFGGGPATVVVGHVTVEVRVTDPVGLSSFTFEVNGAPVDPSQVSVQDDVYRFTFRPSSPGQHTITARATNESGLSTARSLQVYGVPAG